MIAAEDRPIADLRSRAFAIAYRMLGSVAEAEDIVQEALLRVYRAQGQGQPIESPRAFIATITTRLAIDQLRSARARRETYVGEWLPEPVITDPATEPVAHAEMADSLSLGFLVLLESLSPQQRAALLLHDVFDYGYDEIAAIIGTSEPNARQLTARARRHVEARRPRFASSRKQRDELARRFFAAVEEGDVGSLEALLAHDVVLHGDGGGKVPAIARAVHGRSRVARTLLTWARLSIRGGRGTLRPIELNGQPGTLVLTAGGELLAAVALDIDAGQVHAMRSIVNPDKLRHLLEAEAPADVRQAQPQHG